MAESTERTRAHRGKAGAWRGRRRVVAVALVGLVVAGSLGLAAPIGLQASGAWDTSLSRLAAAHRTPDVGSPFDGTPAEGFADGADGIVLPPAEPVGEFTADEVADALAQVRDALVAARLDPTMLIDHDPTTFLALIAPDQQQVGQILESTESMTLATHVDPGAATVRLPVRVAGELAYRGAIVEGGLPLVEITTRFTWVYGFVVDPNGPAAAGTGLVVLRDALVWQVVGQQEGWRESSRGLWVIERAVAAWGADCNGYDEGRLRPAPGGLADLGADLDAIFDPTQSLAVAEPC